ncbi:MAG: SPFH domain-containing protein, partial [Thermoplasmatales archaeon]|nr:SPFH domain-containing protein [Thermoplasmatales archaeon]
MIDIFGEFCMLGWGMLFFFIFLGLFTFFSGIRIVRPLEKGVVERFGRFKRVTDQGFKWIIPAVDKMYKINLTERMIDVLPQEVITEDNLNAKVDLVVYYKVQRDDESVKKSIYNVDRFETQIVS